MTPVNTPCPSCDRRELQEFARVENVPVHNSLVLTDQRAAHDFPRGDVATAFCGHCGFVTNPLFDLRKIHYYEEYEDQQSFSPTFNAFARTLAADLVERYNLRGKTVLEIGCGKGDFLALLCEFGAEKGIGIDPTARADRLTGPGSDRVRFINELYSEKHGDHNADFICCRHTLEHIPDTAAFLRTVRRAIGDRKTPFFLEVPDVLRVLQECAYWDVYYEHCSYFTPGSLIRLFRSCGFEVTDCRLGFGDQYILLEAMPIAVPEEKPRPLATEEPVSAIREAAAGYEDALKRSLTHWRSWFAERRAAGERVAVWGSGSKCVSFLTTIGLDKVDYVVDINPHRHGKYILGSGLEISSPEVLGAAKPDHVLIMNPVYLNEIREMLADMHVACNVMAV
jgi:SAM-dependent methyltransferase